MGEGMLQAFFAKIRKESKFAFFSAFIIAVLIHMYRFTNTLPNHDALYNYYSDQNVVGSGRWALSLFCGISSYYDLPWLNGLVSCIYIALTVVIIAKLFEIKNPVVICLVGALIASSPSTTETFFFMYTADGYMAAMLLAAVAVYLSRIEEKRWVMWILSGTFVCVSCGIYQAFVSFALILALCYFIVVLLKNEYGRRECLKWILRQFVIFALSLSVYFIIWKLCLSIHGKSATGYQGISEVGKLSADIILNGLVNSIKTVVFFFLQWNVFKHGLTAYNLMNIVFILVTAAGLLYACIKSGLFKRRWATVMLVLCLAAIIPFSCIWNFVSVSVEYRAMMLHSLCLLFILAALIYERWAKTALKNIMCILLIAICFNNTVLANISYFYLNLCYEQSYAEGAEMMADIHDYQDEYEINEIAFVGNRIGEVSRPMFDTATGAVTLAGKLQSLNGFTSESLLINAEHILPFLRETYGLDIKAASNATHIELAEYEEVKQMGCWPAADSITVMDDILVIKVGD